MKTLLPVIFFCLSFLSAPAWAQESAEPDVEVGAMEDSVSSGGLGLSGQIECRRSAGVAGGLVYIGGSWEFVGQGPIALTGSPVFSMMCDGGWDRVALSVGLETAPFYVQRTLAGGGTSEQWMTASVGVLFGQNKWRYGPLLSVGHLYFGPGGRLLWLPWETRKGVGRGFELRTILWVADEVGAQISLQVHLTAHRHPFQLRRRK